MTSWDEFVLRTVEERGVEFIRLWFIDVLGLLKSLSIPVSELESALADGVGLDGSSLEGASRQREHDVIAHPDPRTFQVLPWKPDSLVARMLCEVRQPDDSPFGGDSRARRRRSATGCRSAPRLSSLSSARSARTVRRLDTGELATSLRLHGQLGERQRAAVGIYLLAMTFVAPTPHGVGR